jgi:hypothetical protein
VSTQCTLKALESSIADVSAEEGEHDVDRCLVHLSSMELFDDPGTRLAADMHWPETFERSYRQGRQSDLALYRHVSSEPLGIAGDAQARVRDIASAQSHCSLVKVYGAVHRIQVTTHHDA